MNKHYINHQHHVDNYLDTVNGRFFIAGQKDLDQLFGKIRRLRGRDEIRKKAIELAVSKKLRIPDNLLTTWPDKISDDGDTEMSINVDFKYLTKEERDALPDSDFGYIAGSRRLFPIVVADDVMSAAKLLGRAKGLSDEEREKVKKKIIKIASKKGFDLPMAWKDESEHSVTISQYED